MQRIEGKYEPRLWIQCERYICSVLMANDYDTRFGLIKFGLEENCPHMI